MFNDLEFTYEFPNQIMDARINKQKKIDSISFWHVNVKAGKKRTIENFPIRIRDRIRLTIDIAD